MWDMTPGLSRGSPSQTKGLYVLDSLQEMGEKD
jgi:hypothetical protein